ncbi:hypothetical protein CLAFUW4_05832 [Fulvia fulva]|uniref:Uncharacterized protein n=1 Tax=Passalora fulva TaxID=5499 RepID=A0A9Q8P8T0_PASFU|nr:uncharacterized protein CLAFUR5_05973 [Fulvia fulva]KAK4623720.1 hypothetical protein CLAFUR4_05826 [Fulvia fulva]KAK4625648.1 hypothetical protein CLAFUR0_05837 [Fulvia fulva]UJO17221.1 hypothetical protein CLAFUR5_05973 [Fulvia fulva]WPV15284.1 hypothetical protein CLAFUW4_05832 [Fulvia fulva]WPV30313.1 hypothetical protein CLAFUW7_05830 [Fulvia fulva]
MGEYPGEKGRISGVADPEVRTLSSDPLGMVGMRPDGGTEEADDFRPGELESDAVRAGVR